MPKLPVKIIALIVVVVIAAVGLFTLLPKNKAAENEDNTPARRQVINALPFKDRPFVAIFPHSTAKLITLMVDKPPAVAKLDLEIEYLSGNALKGGRTSISLPVSLPYGQAFLLGSCSAGGKCSFDKDITTGTLKTKLEMGDELHVLKSNFAFVNGETWTSDRKVGFVPGKSAAQLLIGQTHGFIGDAPAEVAAEPAVITSTTKDAITGTLTIAAKDAASLLIYDGSSYQPLEAEKSADVFTVAINHVPVAREVSIIRDDLKGASENVTLYYVGPIVPVK